ncbi:hypothetical protein Glove_302g49 [Diversispora epigaea]|uniref:Uncharacterized protein n=1 Tax=Diversispora epigaea TaxID=1348612 RepID=A0A397HZ00_9GLOM|nr:hypothetical protein Glove_302g49 [Diversispora epigaea]
MTNVHTMRDINSPKGYRLGKVELEEALCDSCITNSELIEDFKNYRKVYSEFSKNIKQDKAQLQLDLNQSNKDKEKLSKHVYQLINEVKRLKVNNTNLTSQITQSQISRDEYKARYDIQLKEIKSHQAMIKILEGKLASAQKDAFSIQESLSKTESENLSLKSKMVEFKQIEVELEHVRSELDHLKSEAISKPVDPLDYNSKNHLMASSAIVGGDDKKNIAKSDNNGVSAKAHISIDPLDHDSKNRLIACSAIISESSNSLRPYLARRKNIEDIEKIDDNDGVIPIPKVSDSRSEDANASETNNSKTSKDIMLDTHINSDPQISVGGIEAIPIVASGLMSPLSAYILLILLFIAVIWFVVLRRELSKKSNQLREINMQKNSKTGLPPMKLFLMDMDEANKHESIRNVGHPAMSWPFSKVVSGKSGTGKTNILGNIFVGDKGECIYKKKKGGSRYIRCDDLIVCGYHPDEPKWAFVRYIYGVIASDPKAPYYENIRFKYISPEKIPSVKSFSPERSTVIIFEDLCVAPETIQNRIIPFFTHGRHHVSKIIGRYTDDVKNASMVINSYLRKNEFIVFDLTRSEDDPLAIRLRFDTPLDLQKEIELRQKRKIKSEPTDNNMITSEICMPRKFPNKMFSALRLYELWLNSYQDVSKIIGRYTDDVKNASMVINSYLRKNEFIVFDLTRSEDDPLAIRLRFDTPLDLQKEIELRQKRKIKSEPTDNVEH